MGIIKAICISEKRGTPKTYVESAELIEDWGVKNDAHGGKWHRQVSLLPVEKTERFAEKHGAVEFGAFGENIATRGVDFSLLETGDRLSLGEAVLEITQKGKKCHSDCEIYKKTGDCIMPREGVFARVIKGGKISVGMAIESMLTACVITLSDKGYAGQREDKSGPLAREMLEKSGYSVKESVILPDDKKMLEDKLMSYSDGLKVNLVITTGGTGFSERDITPEATLAVCERRAQGIPEAIRAYSMTITKRAMLSRAEAGIRGKTLIVNLPGSPKAVRESLEYILPELEHGVKILCARDKECGGKS